MQLNTLATNLGIWRVAIHLATLGHLFKTDLFEKKKGTINLCHEIAFHAKLCNYNCITLIKKARSLAGNIIEIIKYSTLILSCQMILKLIMNCSFSTRYKKSTHCILDIFIPNPLVTNSFFLFSWIFVWLIWELELSHWIHSKLKEDQVHLVTYSK